jgi:hypothetical protein
LYLLDTDAANYPPYCDYQRVYGNEPDLRLMQEPAGYRRMERSNGWVLSRRSVNEGLQRLLCWSAHGVLCRPAADFAALAMQAIFTTHTAVAAGFDYYTPHWLHIVGGCEIS